MRLTINNQAYHFRPRWTMSLLTLLLLSLFCSLGSWQLHRAKEKRQLLTAYTSRMASRPLPFLSLLHYERYQQVSVKGRYLPFSFLLDNKIHQAQTGYEVVTAFLPEAGNQALLINRGWVPAAKNRQVKPVIETPEMLMEIKGLVYFPLKKALVLGHHPETGWPRRIQSLNFEEISQALNRKVYPLVILLDPGQDFGFDRDWQPVVATSPHKHIGYASQWFLFAFVLLILYIVLNFHKVERANE